RERGKILKKNSQCSHGNRSEMKITNRPWIGYFHKSRSETRSVAQEVVQIGQPVEVIKEVADALTLGEAHEVVLAEGERRGAQAAERRLAVGDLILRLLQEAGEGRRDGRQVLL
uniref:CARD domain-containing protein n=1 Tax=Electrophorus electricus TaxID=8005 RepID=A0AAY5EVP4_ELEEL